MVERTGFLLRRADELVVKPNTVELYVEDDGEPMATAQMTGKVIVVQGAQKTEYLLKPAGGNKLEAIGATAPKGDLRADPADPVRC